MSFISFAMAGHSKFKNIMYRKGAQDKKRASLFARLTKEIIMATKLGGADLSANARLRLAVSNAKSNSMPKDNITRAINRGSGSSVDDDYEEIRYEGYAPGGVAVIVDCLTNNRNRSAAEIRSIFSKAGGSLGEPGSVSFMFERKGEIVFIANTASPEDMFEAAVLAGAEDVESSEDEHTIICAPDELSQVAQALEEAFGEPKGVELVWRAQNTIAVTDEESAQKILKFMDNLDDNDDVQNVTANFDIAEELMDKVAL